MTKEKWKLIHDAIDQDMRDGKLQPGDRLPTEPELARCFEAGRHSVRRAISELSKEGKLSVEQGRGTFVDALPRLTYSIGKRTRLHANLSPQGMAVVREDLGAKIVPATERVASQLDLAAEAAVWELARLTRAGDTPISIGRVWHDATRFPDFHEQRQALGSVTKTYKHYGIDDYLRRDTEIYSRRAKPEEVRLLRQHPDQPVMVVRAVDIEPGGRPLGYSQAIWSAGRVRFKIPLEQDT